MHSKDKEALFSFILKNEKHMDARALTSVFWYAVTAMNCVSVKVKVCTRPGWLVSSVPSSFTSTTWSRGWYLCRDWRTTICTEHGHARVTPPCTSSLYKDYTPPVIAFYAHPTKLIKDAGFIYINS